MSNSDIVGGLRAFLELLNEFPLTCLALASVLLLLYAGSSSRRLL